MTEDTSSQSDTTNIGYNEEDTLIDNLKRCFKNLTTLEIKTVKDPDTKGICTKIDLIQGDITNTFNEELFKDPETLRQFHEAQVTKAENIVEKNLEALRSLIELARAHDLDSKPK